MMDPESSDRPTTARWVVFCILVMLGSLVMYGVVLFPSSDMGLFSAVLLVPMILLMLCVACRWAQGRPVAPVDKTSDREIFESMTRHALPAEQVSGLDMFRCPECGVSFQITNATTVEDKVVLCPTCRTRLFVG